MRNWIPFLTIVAAVLFAFFVLLPLIGVLVLVVLALAAAAIGLYFLAPLLAKLPWFRDWITVEEHGGRKTVRFGRTSFTSYRSSDWTYHDESERRYQEPQAHLSDGDVIDVEGREVEEKE